MDTSIADQLLEAAVRLSEQVDSLTFSPPVQRVYNPLQYAWSGYQAYVRLAAQTGCRVVFLGMNPGPWGMAQTGVPFGEVAVIRDWLGLRPTVQHPVDEHPKRPVQGLDCGRSEVSGRRLWGLFRSRFSTPQRFFSQHFVGNYCPLLFLEEGARNRTPDRLPVAERRRLFEACDEHLRRICGALAPSALVGIGRFAAGRAEEALRGTGLIVYRIQHPSPANPAARSGWEQRVAQQLAEWGLW